MRAPSAPDKSAIAANSRATTCISARLGILLNVSNSLTSIIGAATPTWSGEINDLHIEFLSLMCGYHIRYLLFFCGGKGGISRQLLRSSKANPFRSGGISPRSLACHYK